MAALSGLGQAWSLCWCHELEEYCSRPVLRSTGHTLEQAGCAQLLGRLVDKLKVLGITNNTVDPVIVLMCVSRVECQATLIIH